VFTELERLSARPEPFAAITTDLLWADPHTSGHMLAHHLDGTVDISSRTTDTIERSVAWLTGTLGVGVGAGTRVLDLGCGPGLYSNRLAALGAEVTGVDFSERSVRYARDTAPAGRGSATYLLGNYLEVELPGRYDVALMVMCDFCALGPEQRGRLLRRVAGVLDAGGRFLFDVYGLSALATHQEKRSFTPNPSGGFWSPRSYFEFVSTFVYEREKVSLDKYVIVEEDRTRTVYNWLQHYDPAVLRGELDRNGYDLTELLGDLTGAPFDPDGHEFAVITTPRP